jgi:hypothetical protein
VMNNGDLFHIQKIILLNGYNSDINYLFWINK